MIGDEPAGVSPVAAGSSLDAATVLTDALAPRYAIRHHGSTAERVVHLDTVDRRLTRAGIDLAYLATSRRLVARTGSGSTIEQATGQLAWPMVCSELPAGPVRDHIERAAWIRALAAIAVSDVDTAMFAVMNGDDKTVARISWQVGEVQEANVQILAPLIHVVALRGYQTDADRISRLLAPSVSTAPIGQSWIDHVRAFLPVPEEAATARPMTPAQPANVAVAGSLFDLLATIESLQPGVVNDVDTEFLHEFRVLVRRARSIVKLVGHVLPPDLAALIGSEFRWLGQVTTHTRDLDVYLLGLDDLASTISHPRDLEPFRSHLTWRRTAARRDLVAALTSTRFSTSVAQVRSGLAAVIEAPVHLDQTAAELAADRLVRTFRKVTTRARQITATSPGEQVHALRKTCKEMRYLLDLFRPLYPRKRHKRVVADLKELQDVLGDFQDAEVQAATLRELAQDMMTAGDADADAILAMGELGAVFDSRQRAARETLTDHHESYLGDRAARDLRELVRG